MKADITVIIPTFNRETLLKKLLNTLLNSPLAQAPIFVLDNCSMDGTRESIEPMTKTHANLTYIRNTYNMGLAGNLVKAFEFAYTCKTKYFWILFDDTQLDFTHWDEVQTCIQANKPVIGVTNYYQVTDDELAPIFLMLIFPFAGIYQTCLLTPVILLQALTDIYTVHPQMAFLCHLFNNKISVTLTSHPIAKPFKGAANNPETDEKYSFNRVTDFSHFRLSHPHWFVPGFLNAIEGLNEPLKTKCVGLLFTNYRGIGPYVTKHNIPPISLWNRIVFWDTLSALPFRYKIKFLVLLTKSSWRKYVQRP